MSSYKISRPNPVQLMSIEEEKADIGRKEYATWGDTDIHRHREKDSQVRTEFSFPATRQELLRPVELQETRKNTSLKTAEEV